MSKESDERQKRNDNKYILPETINPFLAIWRHIFLFRRNLKLIY